MISIVGPSRAESLMQKIAARLASKQQPAQVFASKSGDFLEAPGLADTTVLVSLLLPCGARQMDAMPRLRGIVSPLLGYEWIDIDEATRRAIPVVNGEIPENRESMAEATIMLMLVLLYRLRETEEELRSGRGRTGQRNTLKGRTIGIVGYGGITREIVRRLAHWQPQILVHTRNEPRDAEGVSFVSREHLLAASDVVVLMTRLDAESRHFLDRDSLRQMKRGALLVNTARGGLVDEPALVEALDSGHVAAAALDVFEVEPLPAAHPFRRLPNVILTPHSVGHTVEMVEQMPLVAAANVCQLLAGGIPASCKNMTVARHR